MNQINRNVGDTAWYEGIEYVVVLVYGDGSYLWEAVLDNSVQIVSSAYPGILIESITADVEYIYRLDSGVILRSRRHTVDGILDTVPGPPGAVVEIASSDEYLFALLGDGQIWRWHGHSAVWNRIDSVPLGVTSLCATPTELQMVHGTGSIISGLWLPCDWNFYATDTIGLTNIVQLAADEKQRLIVLDNGTVYVQDYSGGYPELVPAPAGTMHVEIGEKFAYFLDSAGEIYRSRDYSASALEKLDGVTGVRTMGIPSDHTDMLLYSNGITIESVEPDTWVGPPENTGWVWGVGNTAGQVAWIDADWVDVAI